jgi:hypothetical protein
MAVARHIGRTAAAAVLNMMFLLPLLLVPAAAHGRTAAGPKPEANATASPARMSIEFGGDVTVVGRAPGTAAAAAAAGGAETCELTRSYGTGGYGLTREKLGPDFKHCCSVTANATRLNATAVVCHLPGGLATEGNTTLTTSVGFAYVRHFAGFVPDFSRRPYFREAEGALLVRVAHTIAAEHGPLVATAQVPCGGPRLRAVLQGQQLTGLSPYATYRVAFPLAAVAPTCYEATSITLSGGGGLVPVVRNRTFVRAPPPARGVATTAWSVDHEGRGLLVDGRRFAAQGWFAGSYAHESVGLPPVAQQQAAAVGGGEHAVMGMNKVRKLGQSSMVTEWGRQGHSFVRYGVGAADYIDGQPQTETLLASLDAAAAAGVYVLIGVAGSIDQLARARIGWAGKPGSDTNFSAGLNATQLWEELAGNISLVKGHPAVAAYCAWAL